jgi:hypothetical protein
MNPIQKALADAWAPLDRRSIYDWAKDNIDLPAGRVAIPGPFRVSLSRRLIAPFDSLKDHRVRIVTVLAPIQSGKTLLADVGVPWFIANRPGPIMWNFHEETTAKDHATARAIPIIRSCKALQHLLPDDPRKLGSFGAEFAHCNLYIQTASPGTLQNKSIQLLVNDELWRWRMPVYYKWALARVAAFARVGLSKVLNLSQGGRKGEPMDAAWRAGKQFEWHLPCLACRRLFWPKWETAKWDDTPEGEPRDFRKIAPTIRVECPHCGHRHADDAPTRAAWNDGGEYVAQNPGAPDELHSFHWTAIGIDSLAGLVQEWLEAMDAFKRGVASPLVAFLQARLAECDDPERPNQGETVEVEDYDVASDWPAEVERMLFVDMQEDHYWVDGVQFDVEGNARQLFFAKISTADEIRLLQTGHKIKSNRTFLDVGFQRRGDAFDVRAAYALCVRFGWCGLKGEPNRDQYPHQTLVQGKEETAWRLYSRPKLGDPLIGAGGQGKQFARYFLFASDPVADTVKRIREGRGVQWLARPETAEAYTHQLFAEQKVFTEDKTGRPRWQWIRRRRDNHAFDLAKMRVVACLMCPNIKFEAHTTRPTKGAEVPPAE